VCVVCVWCVCGVCVCVCACVCVCGVCVWCVWCVFVVCVCACVCVVCVWCVCVRVCVCVCVCVRVCVCVSSFTSPEHFFKIIFFGKKRGEHPPVRFDMFLYRFFATGYGQTAHYPLRPNLYVSVTKEHFPTSFDTTVADSST